jgi:hypothetical protein
VANAGPLRHEDSLREQVRAFVEDVAAAMRRYAQQGRVARPDRVGLLLPLGHDSGALCTSGELEMLAGQLRNLSLNPVEMDLSRGADGEFMRRLEGLDWAVTDIGAEACAGGLPAFLQGRFIPQMRLIRSTSATELARSPLEDGILAPFEAGYPKDIVRWHDRAGLLDQFVQRLSVLYEPRKYIGNTAEAQAYFASASLRKETVFLSYAGEDRSRVEGLARALGRVFQNVFDYRDAGQSIVPGSRWIEEIFNKLAGSALAVPVLSPEYFASDNCTHEAREIIARADNRQLKVVPVKLRDGPLELPNWMRDIQYLRGWEYTSAEALAEKIVAAYGAASPARSG